MKFFFDNCISPHLAQALHPLSALDGHSVHYLREKFDPTAPDIDWIMALGTEGDWIVVSGDTRILNNHHERRAWHEAGLTGFFWSTGWLRLKLWEQAWRLTRWWPEIQKQADLVAPGAIFEVPVRHTTRLKQLTLTGRR